MTANSNCCCTADESSCCVETTITQVCGGNSYTLVKRNLVCASPDICAELGGVFYADKPCGTLPCNSDDGIDCIHCVSDQLCGVIDSQTDCIPHYICAVAPEYSPCPDSDLCTLYPECCIYGACCTPSGCTNSTQGTCTGVFHAGGDCLGVDCGVKCCCDTDLDGILDGRVDFSGTTPCNERALPCFAYSEAMPCPPEQFTLNTCGCSTCSPIGDPDCETNGGTCPDCYFCCTGTPVSNPSCFNPITCVVDSGCTCTGGLFEVHLWLCQHGYCFNNTVDITDIADSPCVVGLAPCSGFLQQGGDTALAFLKDSAYTTYKVDINTIVNGAIGMANTVDAVAAGHLQRVTQRFDIGPIELLGFGVIELKRTIE